MFRKCLLYLFWPSSYRECNLLLVKYCREVFFNWFITFASCCVMDCNEHECHLPKVDNSHSIYTNIQLGYPQVYHLYSTHYRFWCHNPHSIVTQTWLYDCLTTAPNWHPRIKRHFCFNIVNHWYSPSLCVQSIVGPCISTVGCMIACWVLFWSVLLGLPMVWILFR